MTKRLYRSRQHKVLAGVCGGVGEYFDIDPVFVRILTVVLCFAHGIGLVAYVVAWIAMPRAPLGVVETEPTPSQTGVEVEPPLPKKNPSVFSKYFAGIVLIVLGVVFLADRIFWWFHWRYIWPILLILGGAALIWKSFSHHKNSGGIHESIES